MSGPQRVCLIVAMAANRVIGRDNQLPWKLSADLKRFKALTLGHALVIGRKTWESIGRPLPGRTMVVCSRSPGLSVPAGVVVVGSIDEALSVAPGAEVFVAGGEQVFRESLPRADRIHLTVIEADYPGDTWFPELAPGAWRVTSSERITTDPTFPHPYRFEVLDRVRST